MSRRALILCVLLAAPHWASADEHPDARNTSIDGNPFHLDPAGQSVLSSGSAQVLGPFEYHLALVGQYISQPVVVRGADDSVLRALIDSRIQTDLQAAIGLFHHVELALTAPLIVSQTGEFPGQGLGAVDSFGLGNITLQAKGTILSQYDFPVALALSVPVTLPTGNSDAYMGFDGFGVEPRIHVSVPIDIIDLSLAVGYLFQPNTNIFAFTDSDKLTYALGVEASLAEQPWTVALELAGSTAAFDMFGNPDSTNAEVAAGFRYIIDDQFEVTVGAGKGLLTGVTTPNVRGFLSFAYHPDRRTPTEDPDADGIVGWNDQCRFDAEDLDDFEDADGCPDLDNDSDGLVDAADDCPMEPEDLDGFQDMNGCPDPDNDDDTVLDTVDQCPDEAEDVDTYEDEDGCPDDDNDGDGILDEDDKCPLQPENLDGVADEDGCPEILDAIAVMTPTEIVISEAIHFELGTANLTVDSTEVLDDVLRVLREHPDIRVRIEGHTDTLGGRAYNQSLSQARAEAVRAYFLLYSYPGDNMAERLEAQGFGEDIPIANNMTERGRARNRRVEFHIIAEEGAAPK